MNKNTITIKNLYAGRPDAKDEINFDGMEEFIKSFVTPQSFDITSLISGHNCFITGYKGTGKTALLFYLDDLVKRSDASSCSSFIFFKESFTDIKKSELESFSNRILSSISINNDTMISNTDFEYIWRWLFFKRIVSDNQDYNNGIFEENNEWYTFKRLVDKIKAPSNLKKTIIPPKLKIAVPFKDTTTLSEISPELEVDFQKSHNDQEYMQFINIIDEMESAFLKLTKTDIPYYIFVDELEAYYGDESIFKRDLYLIRDLIFTIKRFNSLFVKLDKKCAKIICSIRSEIIKSISRFIVTKEINKIISGFEVPLIWDYNNTSSYAHPIMQILIKRIGICESPNDSFDSKDVYQRWFPEKIHDIEPANYILNNNWFKPRDIVRLLLSAQNSINGSSTMFSQSVFDACLKRYSSESLTEIMEEMRALYDSKQIENIISCFTGFRGIFSVKLLKERVDSMFPNTIMQEKFTEVLTDLYRLGFLGNFLPASKTYRWQHKGDDGVILSDEWRLMIHQALQSALSVGKKQDYALKRNDPPQTGDVLYVTISGISKSFVFVKFDKNNKNYDGCIHISEIEDCYINDLREYVDVGDEFMAVILSFNESHNNWILSKKKAVIFEN